MCAWPDFAIKTYGLGRRFGSHWAVNDLSLAVPFGSVYGFLGLNGSGKTTTIRMLMGLLRPNAGAISVLGIDPEENDIEVKRRVGYVADTPNFYDWMTVRELAAFVSCYRRGQWDAGRVDHLLQAFKLPRDQKIRTLSKGQRAKVSLTLALGFNPDMLILDEPVGGLDPVARRQFFEGVLAEYMDGERTVFISSHLINEISGLVDHVGILKDGQLIRSEPTESLLAGLKRARLIYETEAPNAFACTGLVRSQCKGREARLTIDQFHPERTMAELAHLGAGEIVVEDLSLEDAFVELVGGRDTE